MSSLPKIDLLIHHSFLKFIQTHQNILYPLLRSNLTTIPETKVPANPEDKMTISTTGREIILRKVADIALYVVVKYSLIRLSATMIDILLGDKTAINHVRHNNTSTIKENPKTTTTHNQ